MALCQNLNAKKEKNISSHYVVHITVLGTQVYWPSGSSGEALEW